MVDHSDGSVEGSHEMRGHFSSVVHEHLSVLLSNGDQEPVEQIERDLGQFNMVQMR